MQNFILIDGGDHCKSCIDLIEQTGRFQVAGIVNVPEKLHNKILGYEIIVIEPQTMICDGLQMNMKIS